MSLIQHMGPNPIIDVSDVIREAQDEDSTEE